MHVMELSVDSRPPKLVRNPEASRAKILEAARIEIGKYAVDHRVEVFMRYAETAHGVVERRPQGVIAEAAFEGVFHLPAPAIDGGAPASRAGDL